MSWDKALGADLDERDTPLVRVERAAVATADRSHSRRRRRRRVETTNNKRLDIQGLRAVAVVAVVITHLTTHPQGGFVGVDVFFVISGFLISAHLLREEVKRGKISLLDFYKRRIRRLFPAALTVTVATIAVAYLAFNHERYHHTLVDGLWATGFSANWHFITVGTDYFQAEGPVSPLQHYWSLSVEEQFYLVWPLVLLVTLKFTRALFRGRQNVAALSTSTAALLLTGGSLVVAWRQSSSEPVHAYFSTFTRGWELGLGAILAILAPYMRGCRWFLTLLSWAGLGLIGWSLFFVTERHFPFPWGLVPTIGSGLVIVAWTARAAAFNPLLTNPVSVYLGDISYSIYVVHFPVIIFAQSLVTTKWSAGTYTAVALGIIGGSMLLFHLIENPVRESNWLRPKRERGMNVAADHQPIRLASVGGFFAVAGLAVAILVAPPENSTYQQAFNAVQGSSSPPAGASTNPNAPAPEPLGPKVKALDEKLKSAVLAQSWPKLNPPIDQPAPHDTRACSQDLKPASDCTWGDTSAKKSMYLVGDSTSAMYFAGFGDMIEHVSGWKMRAAGGAGCAFADKTLADGDNNQWAGGCPERNKELAAEIAKVKPDVVIVTFVSGDQDSVGSIERELEKVKDDIGKIVIVPPTPKTKDPQQCYSRTSTPADCLGQVPSDYLDYLANENAMAKRLGGVFVNTEAWYCVDGYCPAFVDDVPIRRDAVHITATYSHYLAPIIRESLDAHHVFS